jgi:ubiquinone/menaquinone biosynthesis C-methylase UbiE
MIERQLSMQKAESSPDLTRKRYNRIAFLYDLMEASMERFRFASWRQRLMDRIAGPKALEVGVGSGKNLITFEIPLITKSKIHVIHLILYMTKRLIKGIF